MSKIYPVEYVWDRCPNCGRFRVELYNNGMKICEKCRWCMQTNDYVLERELEDDDDESDHQ